MSTRVSYNLGRAARAALAAVGALGAAAWIGTHGASAGTAALACGIMVAIAALGEVAAWHVAGPRGRRIESLARRGHRVAVLLAVAVVLVTTAALGQQTGLLAGVGSTAPNYMPLLITLGVSPDAIVTAARYGAAAFAAACIGVLMVAGTVWTCWRAAPDRERRRLGGRADMARIDLAVVLAVPLLFGATAFAGSSAVTVLAVAALALVTAAVLADLAFLIALWAPRLMARRTAEDSLRLKCKALMLAGLLAASLLGRLVWQGLGEGLPAAAAGFVAMTAVLAGTSWQFWQLDRHVAGNAPRPFDRPQWVTHLFVVALFLNPLGWAKDTELFQVRSLGDVVWSPRVLLIAVMACAAAALLYAMQTWLQQVERDGEA